MNIMTQGPLRCN